MIKKTKSKFIFEAIVLAVALAITLPLRTLQYLNNIEEHTGFYKEIDFNVIIYVAILAIASLCFIASAFMSRKKVSLERKPMKLPGCGIFSALTAIGIAWSGYSDYMAKDVDTSAYTVSSTAAPGLISIIHTISLVFAILAAIYFGVLAINFITGKAPDKIKLMSLAPVLWSMFRIIERITRTISYLRVSDLALEMVGIACLIIFFMAFAQANSNVNAEGCEWKLVGLGLTSVLFTLNCFIPRAVLVLTNRTDYMYILSKADVSDIAIALFILGTIYTRIVPKISNIIEEPAEENAETQESVVISESESEAAE